MDDSFIKRGSADVGAGNTFVREVLQVITDAGLTWDATSSTQLSAALRVEVSRVLLYDHIEPYFEVERITTFL